MLVLGGHEAAPRRRRPFELGALEFVRRVEPSLAGLLLIGAIVAFDFHHVRRAGGVARKNLGVGAGPNEAPKERCVMPREQGKKLELIRSGRRLAWCRNRRFRSTRRLRSCRHGRQREPSEPQREQRKRPTANHEPTLPLHPAKRAADHRGGLCHEDISKRRSALSNMCPTRSNRKGRALLAWEIVYANRKMATMAAGHICGERSGESDAREGCAQLWGILASPSGKGRAHHREHKNSEHRFAAERTVVDREALGGAAAQTSADCDVRRAVHDEPCSAHAVVLTLFT